MKMKSCFGKFILEYVANEEYTKNYLNQFNIYLGE